MSMKRLLNKLNHLRIKSKEPAAASLTPTSEPFFSNSNPEEESINEEPWMKFPIDKTFRSIISQLPNELFLNIWKFVISQFSLIEITELMFQSKRLDRIITLLFNESKIMICLAYSTNIYLSPNTYITQGIEISSDHANKLFHFYDKYGVKSYRITLADCSFDVYMSKGAKLTKFIENHFNNVSFMFNNNCPTLEFPSVVRKFKYFDKITTMVFVGFPMFFKLTEFKNLRRITINFLNLDETELIYEQCQFLKEWIDAVGTPDSGSTKALILNLETEKAYSLPRELFEKLESLDPKKVHLEIRYVTYYEGYNSATIDFNESYLGNSFAKLRDSLTAFEYDSFVADDLQLLETIDQSKNMKSLVLNHEMFRLGTVYKHEITENSTPVVYENPFHLSVFPKLEFLELSNILMHPDSLDSLPDSLYHLKLNNCFFQTGETVIKLPTGLSKFSFATTRRGFAFPTIGNTASLSSLADVLVFIDWHDFETFPTNTDIQPFVSSLPASLYSLSIDLGGSTQDQYVPAEQFEWLSFKLVDFTNLSGLVELSLRFTCLRGQTFDLNQFPKSVKRLELFGVALKYVGEFPVQLERLFITVVGWTDKMMETFQRDTDGLKCLRKIEYFAGSSGEEEF